MAGKALAAFFGDDHDNAECEGVKRGFAGGFGCGQLGCASGLDFLANTLFLPRSGMGKRTRTWAISRSQADVSVSAVSGVRPAVDWNKSRKYFFWLAPESGRVALAIVRSLRRALHQEALRDFIIDGAQGNSTSSVLIFNGFALRFPVKRIGDGV